MMEGGLPLVRWRGRWSPWELLSLSSAYVQGDKLSHQHLCSDHGLYWGATEQISKIHYHHSQVTYSLSATECWLQAKDMNAGVRLRLCLHEIPSQQLAVFAGSLPQKQQWCHQMVHLYYTHHSMCSPLIQRHNEAALSPHPKWLSQWDEEDQPEDPLLVCCTSSCWWYPQQVFWTLNELFSPL